MRAQLYRPLLWWDGAAVCVLSDTESLTDAALATLSRVRAVTLIPPFLNGACMSPDVSYALRLVTPPAAEPLTLSQAKAFLRIEHSADDAAITTAIAAARQSAEQYLRIALLPQVWDYVRANPCEAVLRLPFGPAQSITSVTLTNELGESGTMDDALYRLSADGCSVLFGNVPLTEKLAVRFSASSYATAADIPAMLVQGMLHHIAVMVEQRDGAAALPVQSMQCYAPFRKVAL